MNKHSKIYVAGHNGMVGSSIVRALLERGYTNIIGKSSQELDLRRQSDVEKFFQYEKPEYVFLAAAKVGGIMANKLYPSEFLYDNSMIELNIINSASLNGVKKLLFLGSSCIYPKYASQPIKEDSLLTGLLEPTNEAYAIAKILGLKYCQYLQKQHGLNFISVMPTNLYGPNDNYHPENSHVLPAMLRKFHDAKINNSKSVTIWGSGTPLREFLHTDDLADACIFLMEKYNDLDLINIGSGEEISINELANLIKDIVGFQGEIIYDLSKPDGTPRKKLDTSKLSELGWKSSITLKEGISNTYHKHFLLKEFC